MDEPANASIIHRLLQQEERDKEVIISKMAFTPTNSMAFAADKRKTYFKSSYYTSHSHDRSSTVSSTKRKARYFCDNYKIPGHFINRCF